jgi:hypothetical protein
MLITAEGTVVVPTVSGEPLIIDMARVVEASGRIDEIARINPATGQALMAYFLKAWQDVHDIVVEVAEQKVKAKDALGRAEANALLGADEAIKLRGGKPSADLRQAVVAIDKDVESAQDTLHQIEAALSWVQERKDQIIGAWRSARTICGDTRAIPPPRLSGDGPAPAPFGAGEREVAVAFAAPAKIDSPNDSLDDLESLVGTVDYSYRRM